MKKGIYCLENLWSDAVNDKLSVKPILELLEKASVCDHVHHSCATKEEINFMLSKWKTKAIQSKYPILYFAFHGEPEAIQLSRRNETYSLKELGNYLADACVGKVIFFASCETLDIDGRKVQTFLKKTGAIAAIGYKIEVGWMLATAFELLVLEALQRDRFDSKGIEKVKRLVESEYGNIGNKLKFRMIINNSFHFPRTRGTKK